MHSGRLVEEIKARIDIVDLIAEYVDLKRAGQNFKGLCPFHSEKTPSFMVNPSRQMFHCFGCSKGGDLFAFIMEHEGMNFQEALSYLAGKAGLEVEQYRGGSDANKGLKEGLFAIHKEASDFFTAALRKSEHALSYLNKRGLDSETIEKFSIGYSKGERDSLLRHLKKKGFPPDHIKASGLVFFGKSNQSQGDGDTHDFFRDRIMFPIADLQGRVIAFGGRILSSAKNLPKYINSPDSILFKKGESCYGMDIAKSSITRKGYSIIVEGYLDSIMCHRYGFSNAVAPLGTALTPGHLKRLKRFSPKVLLLFDGDSAGMSAARRSLELIYAEGMIAKVLLLPLGEDPDTFLRKHGGDYLRKYMVKAVSPVEFVLRTSGKNKLDAVRSLLSAVLTSPDPLQRDETLRELSGSSGISEQSLREELKNVSRRLPKGKSPVSPGAPRAGGAKGIEAKSEEEILLNIALSMPERAETIVRTLDPESLDDPLVGRIFGKVKTLLSDSISKDSFIDKLLAVCSGEEQQIITKFSVALDIDREHVDGNISDCCRRITLKSIERQIKEAEQTGDEKLLHSLTKKRRDFLENERRGN